MKVHDIFLRDIHNCFEILESLDFINRDINIAKVYGVDYESVLSRGSQFRVEAML